VPKIKVSPIGATVMSSRRYVLREGAVVQLRSNRLRGRRSPNRVIAFRRIRAEEFGDICAPAEAVWALIVPAENAPMLEPTTVRGYAVPGTPDGVGQRQAFEYADGTSTEIEVVEYVHNRLAVTVVMSPAPPFLARTVWQVVRRGPDESRLTIGYEVDLARGLRLADERLPGWRAWAAQHIATVRAVVTADT
jgi:hypothetical protein